jgi:hypothetical protein
MIAGPSNASRNYTHGSAGWKCGSPSPDKAEFDFRHADSENRDWIAGSNTDVDVNCN